MFETLARMFRKSPRPHTPAPPRPAWGRPQLEVLEDRVVPSLTPIAANAGYPYSAVVEIQATFPDGKTYVGSSAMVDPSHVLTAGHVLYSPQDGGYARTVTVTPDLNGSSAPFGTAYATYDNAYGADGLAAYEGNVTVVPGQSGSPLFNARDTIYGVVSGYSGSTASNSIDYFSRITQSVYNELRGWGA